MSGHTTTHCMILCMLLAQIFQTCGMIAHNMSPQ